LPEETKAHKEVVLQLYGLKHALKPASEAGIDLSNAPGTCVSLLPEDPEKVACEIKAEIGKNVCVMIIDTDATYMKNGKYFTGLPIAIDGIESDKGFFGYAKGQLSENMGSTPLGCSEKISVEHALKIANIAEDYQKSLSTEMKTIHSVKKVLGTSESEVTIEALDSITHTPAVIIRKIN
jgi:F420-0:gamma-glutamyl ligase-like protein